VAPQLPAGELLRFVEAGIHYVATTDAFPASGASFSLDQAKLTPPSSVAARLTLFQAKSKIIFDGRELELSPMSFNLLWLLAEAVTRGDGLVSRIEIERCLWQVRVSKTAAADAIRNLRDALKTIGPKKNSTRSLIRTLNNQGYILNLQPSEICLVP
jgi:DNA-binding winged helix-turn-helix (wHTH) protein